MKLQQAQKAIVVLRRAPVGLTDTIEFQGLLAKAYKENEEPGKAEEVLRKFGEAHPDSPSVHEYLKGVYEEWGLRDLAGKEAEIIVRLQKQE